MEAKHYTFAIELRCGVGIRDAAATADIRVPRIYRAPKGFYVYLLANPETDCVFYVGKGKGNRYAFHERECRAGTITNYCKHDAIQEILDKGLKPKAYCLCSDMEEQDAYALETAVINRVGLSNLTNLSSSAPDWLNTIEVTRRRAIRKLETVIPFPWWVKMAPRTEEDIKIYWMVLNGLRQIADRGTYPSGALGPLRTRPVYAF